MPTLISATPEYTVTTDPNDQFPNAAPMNLLEAGGYLTAWAVAYIRKPSIEPTLKEHMEKTYALGKLRPMQMTLHPDDHLSYPGDPDLHPLIAMEQAEPVDPPIRALIYQYGIIAMIENGEAFITRMD